MATFAEGQWVEVAHGGSLVQGEIEHIITDWCGRRLAVRVGDVLIEVHPDQAIPKERPRRSQYALHMEQRAKDPLLRAQDRLLRQVFCGDAEGEPMTTKGESESWAPSLMDKVRVRSRITMAMLEHMGIDDHAARRFASQEQCLVAAIDTTTPLVALSLPGDIIHWVMPAEWVEPA